MFGLATLCVAMSGVLQILFGVLPLGSLAKFLPDPVLGRFMTGVAILIALSQVPHVLGLAPDALRRPALEWRAAAQPLTA